MVSSGGTVEQTVDRTSWDAAVPIILTTLIKTQVKSGCGMDGHINFSVNEMLLQITASKCQSPHSENVLGWIPTCVLSGISRWLTILNKLKRRCLQTIVHPQISANPMILTQNWNIGHKFLLIPLNGCQVWLLSAELAIEVVTFNPRNYCCHDVGLAVKVWKV